MSRKTCCKCKQELPVEQFNKRRSSKDGLQSRCIDCHRILAKSINLKHRYDITLEDRERMLADQNGCCAICGTSNPGGSGNTLHVDHCHATNRVRGLLCHNCNRGIGYLKDSPDILLQALNYLQKSANELSFSTYSQ